MADLTTLLADDYLVWDSTEAATVRSVQKAGFAAAAVATAKRRALRASERAASEGVYRSDDVAWLLPATLLPTGWFVKPGDNVVGADGRVFTVLEATLGAFKTVWKAVCRDLVLSYGLTSLAVFSRGDATRDAAGHWAPVRTEDAAGVECRVDGQAATAEESQGVHGFVRRFTCYLAERVAVTPGTRVTVDGVAYTIVGFDNPDSITDLMSLELELAPETDTTAGA